MHAAEKENDLNDTNKGLEDDKKFLAGIKYLTEGWAAFTDTITVLTDDDDDALELFKKTPLVSNSFFQVSTARTKSQALSMIDALYQVHNSPQLDFIAGSLRGKKIGFEQVINLINDLVAESKKDPVDDDVMIGYRAAEFDSSAERNKTLEIGIADLEITTAIAKEGITATTAEIVASGDVIKLWTRLLWSL